MGYGQKVYRLFQLSFGLAASGGSLWLLGGTALAAEPVVMESSGTSQVTVQIQSVSTSISEDGSGGYGTTESDSSQSATVTSVSSVSALAEPGPADRAAPMGNNDQLPVAPTGQPVAITTSTATVGEHEPVAVSTAGESSRMVIIRSSNQPGGDVTAQQSLALVYRGVVMPLQPTMTAAAPADLATNMPSLPVHDPAKQPPAEFSLLSQLTLRLAQVVVPMALTGLVLFGAALVAAPPLLGLTSVTLLILTYGLWLRRCGHATAARSDLPAAFNFASPRLMDYVRVPVHLRT